MTESEMNAIREMFLEMGAKLADDVEKRLKPDYLGIQATVDGLAGKLEAVDDKLDAVISRLDLAEVDVRDARLRLASLMRKS